MSDLKAQFSLAEAYLKENKVSLSDDIRGRLYGLSKQAIEGDCKMPCPPSSNTILREKWHNWTACMGMTSDKAMTEYVSIVDKNFPSFRGNRQSSLSVDVQPTLPGGVIKKGVLYKQRDIMKGWRPRHFVLQDSFLHYYIEADDPVPRNSLQLSGCIVSDPKPIRVGDTEYFRFDITHPKDTKPYSLSSLTKIDAEDWIGKVRTIASRPPPEMVSSGISPVSTTPRLVSVHHSTTESYQVDPSSEVYPINPEVTLEGIPKDFGPNVEDAVKALVDSVESKSGWDPLFDKNGVAAFRRPGSVITVRGDGMIEQELLAVFGMIMNTDKQVVINPQLQTCVVKKRFSQNTSIQHLKFKQVWPTAARDMCNVVHWRLLKDGRIVIVSFAVSSVNASEETSYAPIEEGVVRAECILGGYVLTPSSTGTMVQYVVQSDLKGTLPSAVVNLVSTTQPLNVANIRKYLDEESAKHGKAKPAKFSSQVMFQDLMQIMEKFGHVHDKSKTHHSKPVKSNSESGSQSKSTANHDKAAEGSDGSSTTSSSTSSTTSKGNKVLNSALKKLYHSIMTSEHGKITIYALLMLLLPSCLYYQFSHTRFRGFFFIVGMAITFRYIVRLYYGVPFLRSSTTIKANSEGGSSSLAHGVSQLPDSRIMIRFAVDLAKLLKYLEVKREESGLDITFTHVALKAAAMSLVDFPFMKGHIHFGSFYRSRDAGVDVSVSLDVSERETVMIKLVDVDLKQVDYIANEVQLKSKELRQHVSHKGGNRKDEEDDAPPPALDWRQRLVKNLSPLILMKYQEFLYFLGSNLGLNIPSLGVQAYPQGLCAIMTSPSREGADADVDITVNTSTSVSTAPIVITLGGIRILPSYDNERKLTGTPVLNLSVVVDTRAASLSECRKFCSRFQQFMNNPSNLEMSGSSTSLKLAASAADDKRKKH